MSMEFEYDTMLPENEGDKHIACMLLVDTSGSMNAGGAIDELNAGLRAFAEALKGDKQARGCAEVAVISFSSSVNLEMQFCPASRFVPPTLEANGLTQMNRAILSGLEEIEARKAMYNEMGISYYRPWMFLLTDGVPTDREYEAEAKKKLTDAIMDKKLIFYPMGIGNVDFKNLKEYTVYNGIIGAGEVFKADAANFKEAFVWLSSSLSQIANSGGDVSTMQPPKMPRMVEII